MKAHHDLESLQHAKRVIDFLHDRLGLTYKQIASKSKLHPSTIARTLANANVSPRTTRGLECALQSVLKRFVLERVFGVGPASCMNESIRTQAVQRICAGIHAAVWGDPFDLVLPDGVPSLWLRITTESPGTARRTPFFILAIDSRLNHQQVLRVLRHECEEMLSHLDDDRSPDPQTKGF